MRVIIIIFLLFISENSFSLDFPDGWRLPTETELSGESMRNSSPTKYAKAEGDFNADGKIDYAYLLKSTNFSGEGLLVKLSTATSYEWKVLDQIDWGKEYPNVNLSMGLELAQKESYQTACSKGYWECQKNEPETLKLEVVGLHYLKFESSDSVFYWNQKTNEFVQVWLSD